MPSACTPLPVAFSHPLVSACLSNSDVHLKSFTPVWDVSTILNGLLSFMTSDEMTSGSISASKAGRMFFTKQSRWWNSNGGGTLSAGIKAGDGGLKFRVEWPELHEDGRVQT